MDSKSIRSLRRFVKVRKGLRRFEEVRRGFEEEEGFVEFEV
jgi:glutaredoxin-related protein